MGVNFFKRCFVAMLNWPTTLGEYHQNVGRSNRVDQDGPIYAAFPSEGIISDMNGIYEQLKLWHRSKV